MDHQIKRMILDALMKVVDKAPTMTATGYSLLPEDQRFRGLSCRPVVSKLRFIVWVDYALSVLNIVAQRINHVACSEIVRQIRCIRQQETEDYTKQTNEICQILLRFARNIL